MKFECDRAWVTDPWPRDGLVVKPSKVPGKRSDRSILVIYDGDSSNLVSRD